MVIRTASGENAEVQARDMFSGVDVIPLPGTGVGSWVAAGRRVSAEKAWGLPPILRGIRILAETVATLPLIIYRGPLGERVAEPTAPQSDLLAHQPNELQTPFDFVAFLIASMLGFGNAYVLKAKSRGSIKELYPIDPSRVVPEVKEQTIKYKVRTSETALPLEMTRRDLIHIPGVLLKDPYVGVSPIIAAAQSVGTALAAEEFAGRFYDNDATPGGVLKIPGSSGKQAALDAKEVWEASNRGSRRAHKTGVLYGGMEYQQIGVDAQAAQIIEAQKWNAAQCANVLGLPSWMLNVEQGSRARVTPEEKNMEVLQFTLAPWMVRIEQGLHADDDLFPEKELAPSFLADGMLRADMASRYASYLQGRQAGWLSQNDIRKKEGLPDIEGGDQYQMTPVGGAPNLQPGTGATDEGSQSEVVEPASPVT